MNHHRQTILMAAALLGWAALLATALMLAWAALLAPPSDTSAAAAPTSVGGPTFALTFSTRVGADLELRQMRKAIGTGDYALWREATDTLWLLYLYPPDRGVDVLWVKGAPWTAPTINLWEAAILVHEPYETFFRRARDSGALGTVFIWNEALKKWGAPTGAFHAWIVGQDPEAY